MHAEPDPTETRPWPEQIASTPATSGLDQSAIQRTLQQVCEQAGWPYAEAWSPSRDGTCQLLPAWYADDSGLDAFRRPTEALHFMPRVGLPSRVLRSKRVMFVADVTTELLFCRRTAARISISARTGSGNPLASNAFMTSSLLPRQRPSSSHNLPSAIRPKTPNAPARFVKPPVPSLCRRVSIGFQGLSAAL